MADNIILVAGPASVGTAIFQNHLVRFLLAYAENFRAEIIPANADSGEAAMAEWEALWNEAKLPQGQRQPKDYAYRIQPAGPYKDKPALTFAFQAAPPPSGERPRLDEKSNFLLILLCDRNGTAGDADLAAFLADLKSGYGDGFTSRCPVLLVACRTHLGSGEGEAPFTGANLPETLQMLQDWPGRYTLGEFDPGTVEHNAEGEPLLYSPKFDDTAKIFRWIYFQFTRYTLVADPFLTRVWKSLIRSAS